jgi:hypothetical protein
VDDCSVLNIGFHGFFGNAFYSFEVFHFRFVALVDVKQLLRADQAFEAYVSAFLLGEEGGWSTVHFAKHFDLLIGLSFSGCSFLLYHRWCLCLLSFRSIDVDWLIPIRLQDHMTKQVIVR